MGMLLLIAVVLSTLVLIASGVWVAIALIAETLHPGRLGPDPSSTAVHEMRNETIG